MKKMLETTCYILLTLFMVPSFCRADELVRYTTDDANIKSTIIRHYSNGRDVVCNNSGYPYFMMYEEGVSTSNILRLEEMDTVYDFEIYEGNVYFCGIGKVAGNSEAVWGYFNATDLLTSLPVNVYYINYPSMKELRALDVSTFAGRLHVVTLGSGKNNDAIVVDAIDETSYWNVVYGTLDNNSTTLKDLAILSDTVVVTSIHSGADSFEKGRLWFIPIPTIPGTSLFPCLNVPYLDINEFVGNKYYVRQMDYNKFATAYHIGFFLGGHNPFTVSLYNGTTYNYSVKFDELSNAIVRLGELGFESSSQTLELLVYGNYQDAISSVKRTVIVEIPTLPLFASNLFAHYYDGVYLQSISFTLTWGNMVTSGIQQSFPNYQYYVKFQRGQFSGSCIGSKRVNSENVMINHVRRWKSITYSGEHRIPTIIISGRKLYSIETICYFRDNTNTEKQ